MRHLVVLSIVLVMSVEARGVGDESVSDVIRALQTRASRTDHLRIRAQWRTFRAPADGDLRDRTRWLRMKPGVDPDFDIEYVIARPWWRLSLFNIAEDRDWPTSAWVDGELRQFQEPSGRDKPAVVAIYGGPDPAWLRGKVFLTPMELEMFDMKREGFLALLRRVPPNTVAVSRRDDDTMDVEFPHPERHPNVMRGRFDERRDWVPLRFEQYTPGEGPREPMSYLMETVETMQVGESYIVAKALIVNRNPNVLPDSVVVTDFAVVEAVRDDVISKESVQIQIPKTNVNVYDLVRMTDKTIDAHGRLANSVSIDRQEILERDRAVANAAEEVHKAAMERDRRQGHFRWLLGAAAVGAVGAGILWFRRRRLLAAA